MGKGRVLYNNIIGSGTVTVATEGTGFEKKFLYDNNQGTQYRTNSTLNATITIDMGSATAIKAGVLYNTSLSATPTKIKFEASTNNFSSTSETETMTGKQNPLTSLYDWYHLDSWNYRYYRFDITQVAGTYVSIGQALIYTDDYTFDADFGEGQEYSVEIRNNIITNESQSGHIYRDIQTTKRVYGVNFNGKVDDTQRAVLITLHQKNYLTFFPNGITGADMMYGFFDFTNQRTLVWNNTTNTGKWYVDGYFEECCGDS